MDPRSARNHNICSGCTVRLGFGYFVCRNSFGDRFVFLSMFSIVSRSSVVRVSEICSLKDKVY